MHPSLSLSAAYEDAEGSEGLVLITDALGPNRSQVVPKGSPRVPSAEQRDLAVVLQNWLTLLDGPQVRLDTARVSQRDHQVHRGLGGRHAPERVVHVVITDERLLAAVEASGHAARTPTHAWSVRGHWRTLRDPEHWRPENVGKKIWVPNYKKGKGILFEKHYELDAKTTPTPSLEDPPVQREPEDA
jgi:hypothetical protein